MNRLEIHIEGIKLQVIQYPSCWNDLNKLQLLAVSKLFPLKKLISDYRISIVSEFLGSKNQLFKQYFILKKAFDKEKEVEKLEVLNNKLNEIDEYIYCVSETLAFLTDKNELTNQIIPKIKGRLHGPSGSLSNITLIEFAKADTAFISYLNTKDETYLNKLIAILYRPKKILWWVQSLFTYNSESRVKYSDECVRRNIKRIKKLNPDLKYAIFLFFSGCREAIEKKYPHVFNRPSDSNDKNTFGWAGLITSLAGTKFGDEDKTAFTNLHNILIHLEMEAITYEKYKRDNKIDE